MTSGRFLTIGCFFIGFASFALGVANLVGGDDGIGYVGLASGTLALTMGGMMVGAGAWHDA